MKLQIASCFLKISLMVDSYSPDPNMGKLIASVDSKWPHYPEIDKSYRSGNLIFFEIFWRGRKIIFSQNEEILDLLRFCGEIWYTDVLHFEKDKSEDRFEVQRQIFFVDQFLLFSFFSRHRHL
jgi:hypothetical protein